jgi:hypothetical protein
MIKLVVPTRRIIDNRHVEAGSIVEVDDVEACHCLASGLYWLAEGERLSEQHVRYM